MANRKVDTKKIASFVGNAAAHRAVYGEFAFTIREAELYEAQAAEIVKVRTWNEDEIVILILRTKRQAHNIIKRLKDRWRYKSYKELCSIADQEIEEYMNRVLNRN